MKKCITILLVFCMLLALAACGKADTTSPENSVSIDTENVEESEETEYSESEQSEYTEPEEEFITVDGSTIKNATGYHNGYNYVTFYDGTSAVFDKEGMEVARFPFAMEYEYTKWLNDDLLLVAGDGFYAYDYYREFVILSLSEGITYDSTKDEEREWICLGAYGNTILVQRYLQGFNTDATYQVGFTDQYGTEPESWINVPDTAEIDHDLGEGMYQIHFKGEKNDQSKDIYRLCNLSERTIITLSDYLFFLKEDGVKFYDGYVVNGTEDSKKMDTSGNVSRTFGEGISSFGNSGYNTAHTVYAEGLIGFQRVYPHGNQDDYRSGYFDVNGNCMIDLKEYTERYIFRKMGAFLNGHTGVILEAKDNGQKYYACFDSKGQLMYEPFFEEDNSASITLFDGGYYIKHQNQTDTVYDVTGETYQPLVDDMSFLPDNVQFEGQNANEPYWYSEGIFTVKADLGTGSAHIYEPCYEFYQKDGTQIYLQMKVDPMDGEF